MIELKPSKNFSNSGELMVLIFKMKTGFVGTKSTNLRSFMMCLVQLEITKISKISFLAFINIIYKFKEQKI